MRVVSRTGITWFFLFLRLFRFLLELFNSFVLPGLSVSSGGPSRFNKGATSDLARSVVGMKLAWARLNSGVVGFPGTGTCRIQGGMRRMRGQQAHNSTLTGSFPGLFRK